MQTKFTLNDFFLERYIWPTGYVHLYIQYRTECFNPTELPQSVVLAYFAKK